MSEARTTSSVNFKTLTVRTNTSSLPPTIMHSEDGHVVNRFIAKQNPEEENWSGINAKEKKKQKKRKTKKKKKKKKDGSARSNKYQF